ncbi:hypothetical protein Tco_0764281 [Tanacetum coccineum]
MNFEEEFSAIVFEKIKGNSFDSEQGGIMGEHDDEREDYETEFPVIVFNNTSDTTPPCEPTLGGARRRMTWRQFILALGLHTEQEMAEAGFGAYWAGSDRLIPDKGGLRDY